MRGGAQFALAGAAAAVAMLVFAGSAGACSCAPITGKDVRNADGAAVMKLESVDETGGGAYEEGSGKAHFNYVVGRVYRGGNRLEKGEIVTIVSSTQSAACGLPSREGRRYGLLLDRRKGEWSSSSCGAMKPRKLRKLAEGGGQGGGGSGTYKSSSDCR